MESPTPEARTQYEKAVRIGVSGMALSLVIGVAATVSTDSPAAVQKRFLQGKVEAAESMTPTRRGQTRRVFARISTATATNANAASTGCHTGAHHSRGMRNSSSRVPGDDGQRRYT